MAEQFELPEADATITVNITFNLTECPYLTQWYQATRKSDDTPSTFVRRVVREAALEYRASGICDDIRTEREAERSASSETEQHEDATTRSDRRAVAQTIETAVLAVK